MRRSGRIDRHLERCRLVLASLAGGGVACRLRRAGRRRRSVRALRGITGSTGTVKVAVLLPISSSGSTPAVAKALKQAAELALFDFDNPNVTLIPKDTKGSPEGARDCRGKRAARRRRADHRPALRRTRCRPRRRWRCQGGVPMIAFSSDEKVAGNGVYLLSFLAGRDVPRIVSYALSQGKRNFAELDSAIGLWPHRRDGLCQGGLVRRRAGGCARELPAQRLDSHARSGAAGRHRHQVRPGHRCAVLARRPRRATRACAAAGLGGTLQRRACSSSAPGSGTIPISAATGPCSAAGTRRPTPRAGATSSQRYSKTYGGAPPRIASLAYDAISLAVSLSANPPGQRFTAAQLTRPTGFSGVDGLFRLLSDGTCERGLAILEVREGGPQVIDPAPSSFATASSY